MPTSLAALARAPIALPANSPSNHRSRRTPQISEEAIASASIRHDTTTTLYYYHTSTLPHYHTTTLPHYHTTTLRHCHTSTLPHCHTTTPPHYHTTTLPHYHTTQIVEEAIASGITTLYGGGTGPAAGTCATTCSPAPSHVEMMLKVLRLVEHSCSSLVVV
jgi:hypothetical protein